MFGFVNEILANIHSIEKQMVSQGVSFSISVKAYYAIAIISLILYLAFNVMLYLFMAFGLKHIYKKKGLDKAYLVWIPIVQVYALVRSFSYSKIFNIKKNTYATAMLVVSLIYYLNSLAIDVIYYSKDICRFIFKGSTVLTVPDVHLIFQVVDYISYLIFTLGFVGTVIAFFKERVPNSVIWLSILCVFFVDIFPIFVFAYRKRETVQFANYRVVYTNYGNYEKPYNPQPKPKADEPFSEFNEAKPDYSEPFAEFNDDIKVKDEEITQRDIRATVNEQPQEQAKDNYGHNDLPEDDDDLFN